MNMINFVAESGKLDEETDALAKRLADELSSFATRSIRRGCRGRSARPIDEELSTSTAT